MGLVAGAVAGGCESGPSESIERLGPAPAFSALDSRGEPVDLSDYAGRVLVIDFWATWCGPCRASMPDMHALAHRYANDPGVAFLAVHTDETGDPVAFFAERGYDTRLVPRGREVAAAFEVYTLPTYVVIDPGGSVTYRHESQLTRAVRERLAEQIDAARSAASFP